MSLKVQLRQRLREYQYVPKNLQKFAMLSTQYRRINQNDPSHLIRRRFWKRSLGTHCRKTNKRNPARFSQHSFEKIN